MIAKLEARALVDENWKTINAIIDALNTQSNITIRVHSKSVVGKVTDGAGAGGNVDVPPCLTNGRVLATENGITIVLE